MENQVQEAVKFFKNNKGYHRILLSIEKNYISRGIIGGSVYLKNLTDRERLILCKFDRKFIDANDGKFPVKKFIKTFENTPLEGVDFHQVLEIYLGREIEYKQNLKAEANKERRVFFQNIVKKFDNTPGGNWLKTILETKEYGYAIIIREYKNSHISLGKQLENVIRGANELVLNSSKHIRLAIFASKISKDPHYFDSKRVGGKLLINALAFFIKTKTPDNSEGESEILFRFGIIKDEISNYTTCSNISGNDSFGEHLGLKEFNKRNQPVQLNLYNLSQMDHFSCVNNRLYVFENPTVFTEVLQGTTDIKPSLLCTSGQIKLASLVLLDKLVDNIDMIYYSGDFDPEGISIANRLKQRYGKKLTLWKYDVNIYKSIISNVEFDEKRFKQLDNNLNPDIKELVDLMKKTRRCAYQELLVNDYISDIRNRGTVLPLYFKN